MRGGTRKLRAAAFWMVRGQPQVLVSGDEVGSSWCWGDEAVPLPAREECCRPESRCFEERLAADGKPLLGEHWAVFARAKCCDRPANASSFFGFVNPSHHDVAAHRPETVTAQIIAHFAVQLPVASSPPVWTLVHSDAEVPRQVAWELARFQRHQVESLATFDARRLRHRHGRYPCADQLERLGSAALNGGEFLSLVREALGWRNGPESRFVNVGANNGLDDDPLGDLLLELPLAWAVAVEVDPVLCRAHRRNLPHVHLWCGAATPAAAWAFMDPWLPDDPSLADGVLRVDVLKVDIDSYDCALIEALLKGAYSARRRAVLRLQPDLLLTEVNDAIPPPLQQALLFNPATMNVSLEHDECAGNIPLAGCSLSYQVNHFARYGYSLLSFAAGNAVFAHESALDRLGRVGLRGPVDEFECFWHAPVASQCVSGRQLRRWTHEPDGPATAWDVLAEVWQHLKGLEKRFDLPAMPVVLEV